MIEQLNGFKERVETSGLFREWKKKNPKAFFYLVFAMFNKLNEIAFELSFFDPEKKLASIFGIESDNVLLKDTDKIYSDKVPEPLDLKKVKIGFVDALDSAQECLKKNYSKEIIIKNLVLLQTMDGNPIWNITFFTQTFSTINIRVDAAKNNVLEHSLQKLFDVGI